jgi:hypothetical protein
VTQKLQFRDDRVILAVHVGGQVESATLKFAPIFKALALVILYDRGDTFSKVRFGKFEDLQRTTC